MRFILFCVGLLLYFCNPAFGSSKVYQTVIDRWGTEHCPEKESLRERITAGLNNSGIDADVMWSIWREMEEAAEGMYLEEQAVLLAHLVGNGAVEPEWKESFGGWLEIFTQKAMLTGDPGRIRGMMPLVRHLLEAALRDAGDGELEAVTLWIDRFRLAETFVETLVSAGRDISTPAEVLEWLEQRRLADACGAAGASAEGALRKMERSWAMAFPAIARLVRGERPAHQAAKAMRATPNWTYFFITPSGSWVILRREGDAAPRKLFLGEKPDWAGMIWGWYEGLFSHNTPRVFPTKRPYDEAHRIWLSANYRLAKNLRWHEIGDSATVLIPDGPLEAFSWGGLLRSHVPDTLFKSFHHYDYFDMPSVLLAGWWDFREKSPARNGDLPRVLTTTYPPAPHSSYDDFPSYRRHHLGPIGLDRAVASGKIDAELVALSEDALDLRMNVHSYFTHIKVTPQGLRWWPYGADAGELSMDWYAVPPGRDGAVFLPAVEWVGGDMTLRRLALWRQRRGISEALMSAWRIPERQLHVFTERLWPLWTVGPFDPGWIRGEGRGLYRRGTSNLYQDPYFLDAWVYTRSTVVAGRSSGVWFVAIVAVLAVILLLVYTRR